MSFIKKILSSFKNIHFQSLLGNGVMAIFGMVTIAILYRALSVKDIGVYVFFMTILGLIDTLRSGFLTNSFIKFYSGTEKDRAQEVAGSAWGLALLITGGSILINIPTYIFSSYITNEGMILFLKYFSLISLATLPSFMANLVVQGDKRFDRLLWLRLINQFLFTGIVITLTVLKLSTLKTIILTYIFSNLIASLASMFLGWTMIGTITKFTKKTFLELFHFGKYSVGTSVSSNLFKVTDTFFINFFLGPAALAVYNLGGRLLQIIEIPLLSFAASGMPSLSGYYNRGQKQEMMYVMQKLVGMLSVAIFVIAVGSIIFAEPIILLIGGEKYLHTEAPNLFRIFMSMAILYPADRFFALTLDVIHKPKINFYKILVMLVVNLLGDYFGLMIFKSVYSIVFANILPILVAIIIAYVPLNKYSKFNFWHIYVVGYKEVILFVKQIYTTLTGKEKPVNN
ncbi:oligosaccharide flippase family protein [Pedobacter cryoconitis]|uniref:O-antigen/teichoic acid export membrane protein n=1 Tax=Pedobacter cryoconitis TaxID=188932 RepID=A0A7X0MI27_9SPHI|nr:oligosaccharide flippase family protein [Pedobacter cryoconitis]MBB6498110.1 O-antigen/teichoic acid export membrane protein [Pedobacter cryoconitis]